MEKEEISISELDDSAGALARLHEFYTAVYTPGFPDADERESLENMAEYLRLKAAGWYGANNYHLLVVHSSRSGITAGIVADYLAGPNTGVIEFIVVAPEHRSAGLGRLLLETLRGCFRDDARAAGHEDIRGICAEVNDPFRRCEVQEHLDGFARLRMWDRFGYRLIDFPYVQPPLSEGQEGVSGLGLMFLPLNSRSAGDLPAPLVEQIVADFQIWAMRIPKPEAAREFRAMQEYLRARERVALLDMREYICAEDEVPFSAVEIRDGDTRQLAEFAALYTAAFSHDETAVDVAEFSHGSRSETGGALPHHYWLWGLTAAGETALSGFASFFSFPHCGFGGYVALAGPLRGKGCFRRFLRLMEKQIVQVNDTASGWYVECEPDSSEAAIFKKCAFTEVPMTYLQPRLHTDLTGVSDGKRLELLYKPFGRVYRRPVLTLRELKRDLREILARIYRLDGAGVESALARMTWPAGDDERGAGADTTDVFAARGTVF